MCGLAGLFDSRGTRAVDRPLLQRMNDVQTHRGPDGEGLHVEDGLGFAHRRLSIIDLHAGQQPMYSADGQIVIVYNGEIYNFKETRRTLEEVGYRFRTSCDTEVIIYAWMEWGEACLQHFRGMFAFALFDKRTQSLFLARDRLGVKPLHYALQPDGWIAFSSELKSLLAHADISRQLDLHAVEDYFAYGYVPDPRTILAGVRKLPAGHYLLIRRGAPVGAPVCYWDLDFTRHRHSGSVDDLAEELMAQVREAVQLRLVSDVPIGAFLSGGVDSSAVVALMAGMVSGAVNTCSIGFDVQQLDESDYARRLAERYGTNHQSRTVAADDFSLVDTLARAYDEPFADASALPMYRVCELARENVTVALSGDGADEMLAGYRRYRMHMGEEKLRSLLPSGLRQSLFGTLGRFYPKMDWAPRPLRAKTTFQALAMDTAQAYFNSVSVVGDAQRAALFSPAFRRELQGYQASELYRQTMQRAPTDDPLSQAQYADIKIWLPGDILTKVDRASMAVSLEAREPLLDHKLMEWCAALSPSLRLRGGQGKWLFKKALEPMVPKDLLYRPKMGFVVPIAQWFRKALRPDIESLAKRSLALDTGWFDAAYVRRCVEEHTSGARDHSRLLWQLFMLDRSLGLVLGQASNRAAA